MWERTVVRQRNREGRNKTLTSAACNRSILLTFTTTPGPIHINPGGSRSTCPFPTKAHFFLDRPFAQGYTIYRGVLKWTHKFGRVVDFWGTQYKVGFLQLGSGVCGVIIVMSSRDKSDLHRVVDRIEELGYKSHIIHGVEKTVVAAVGDERGKYRLQAIESMPGVESVMPVLQPFKLVGREVKQDDTVVDVRGVKVGGNRVVVIAGPCSVESRDQIIETARLVKQAGATILRGGAFKPRTSPYSFQGLEKEGLELLAEAREDTGLPIVTEVMSSCDLELVMQYADLLQIGARNMQNFALLKEIGTVDKPVLLKRGMMSTVNEWLMSAEYIMANGNYNIVLCERGIRTFENITRSTLDLNAVPVVKELSHLPLIVDPSHGTGKWRLVTPMCRAAVAAGADGVMVEVHPRPEEALSDGFQSLKFGRFEKLMAEIRPVAQALGREV